MFLWLCGRHESFQNLGGQSWPLTADQNDTPYGFPAGLPRPRIHRCVKGRYGFYHQNRGREHLQFRFVDWTSLLDTGISILENRPICFHT